MVATLTGIFGVEHLTLAEDVVQEALARALQTWPFYGVPKNPPAWLMQTARNRALDVVRRQKNFRDKEAEIIRVMERVVASPDAAIFSEEEIADDRLRLMFVCCHPQIPAEAENAGRFRGHGDCPGIFDDGRGDCQAIDPSKTKNRRSQDPL